MRQHERFKSIVALVVLFLGSIVAGAMIINPPQVKIDGEEARIPLVKVIQLKPQSVAMKIQSQGVVRPKTEINLVSEVTGVVTEINPVLVAGGFFTQGEVLVKVDPRSYDFAIDQAQARLAEAKRKLTVELAQAQQASDEWQALGEGQPSALTLHKPQLFEAKAYVKSAQAELSKILLQRSRCDIKAPFAGRVNQSYIGLGQYLQPGEKLANLYATDRAEVRLPITVDQLAYLDVSLRNRKTDNTPVVVLSADIAGVKQYWQGRIVRSESQIDEATGLLYVVAEVLEPYSDKYQQPLLAGLFVKAEIQGQVQEDLFILPSVVVNVSQQVYLVNDEHKLQIKKLEVLRHDTTSVLVKAGLNQGDLLIVSGLSVPVEGMSLEVERVTLADLALD